MIIGTPQPHPLGSVYTPIWLTDKHAQYIDGQPLFVIREATRAEWEAQPEIGSGKWD